MKRRRADLTIEKKKKTTVVAKVIPRLKYFSYKNTNNVFSVQYGRSITYNELLNLSS